MAIQDYAKWHGKFCVANMGKIGFHSELDKIIKQHTDEDWNVSCWSSDEEGDEKVELYIDKLKCVPLEEIAIPNVWNPPRYTNIQGWANKEKLMSLNVDKCLEGEKGDCRGTDTVIKWTHLPDYARVIDLDRGVTHKYDISDGIHRTNYARDIGAPCIMAQVTEMLQLSRAKFLELSKKESTPPS